MLQGSAPAGKRGLVKVSGEDWDHPRNASSKRILNSRYFIEAFLFRYMPWIEDQIFTWPVFFIKM